MGLQLSRITCLSSGMFELSFTQGDFASVVFPYDFLLIVLHTVSFFPFPLVVHAWR